MTACPISPPNERGAVRRKVGLERRGDMVGIVVLGYVDRGSKLKIDHKSSANFAPSSIAMRRSYPRASVIQPGGPLRIRCPPSLAMA